MSGRPNGNTLRMLLGSVMATGFAVTLPGLFGVRINTTNSLPKGIYLITDDTNAPLVEFCPPGAISTLSVERGYRPRGLCPDGAAPLLKPVIAHGGDTVVVSAEGIGVNGRLLPNTAPQRFDTAGRPLAAWPPGVYPVATAAIWVASTHHPRSFDSRYFGPIPLDLVRHRLKPLCIRGSASIGQ